MIPCLRKYAYPVQEYIYVTLTDHIFCSYQAVQQGRYKYSDLPDVSAMHPIPYKIAKEAIEIFRKRLLDQVPDDEGNRRLPQCNKEEMIHQTVR